MASIVVRAILEYRKRPEYEDGVREISNHDKFVCLRGKPLYDFENSCALEYFVSGKARRICVIGIFFRCNSIPQAKSQLDKTDVDLESR